MNENRRSAPGPRLRFSISDACSGAAIIVSLFASLIAYWQIRSAEKIQKEVLARQMFLNYLNKTQEMDKEEYVDFVCPKTGWKEWAHEVVEGVERVTDKGLRYFAYVTLMMRTFDTYIGVVPLTKEFCVLVTGRLECHASYLSSERFKSYGARVIESAKLKSILEQRVFRDQRVACETPEKI